MREYYVWTDKYDFISIEEMEVIQSLNNHGKACIKGVIHEKDKEAYAQSLLEEQWVKIIVKDEEENMAILFCGLVLQAEIEDGGVDIGLKLELITGTFLLDREEHYRILQRENYTLREVMDEIGENYSQYRYHMNEEPDEIEGIRVQYRETDWQFLKRLAGETGCCIVPNCYREGIEYDINACDDKTADIEETEFTFLVTGKKKGYIIQSRKLYRLGAKVSFNNQIFYICKITTRYLHAECIHEYQLLPKQDIRMERKQNKEIAGCSLQAVVRAVKTDKVQVEFLKNEVSKDSGIGEIQIWFGYSTVYSTPAGAGWYCMPEPGDMVRIYFPSDKERESYAISAVHMNDVRERRMPERKSIKNIHGKEILLTPDALVMTNNKGMTIKLVDGEGILIESNKDVNIIAEGDMVLSSKASVMIAGTERVEVNQSGTGITLDKDILFNGSEFRIQ
ncbi:MAG: phage late control D family protein [Eubacterium sp.]|nr:phage late control D family protein [Eubacterium sp.]